MSISQPKELHQPAWGIVGATFGFRVALMHLYENFGEPCFVAINENTTLDDYLKCHSLIRSLEIRLRKFSDLKDFLSNSTNARLYLFKSEYIKTDVYLNKGSNVELINIHYSLLPKWKGIHPVHRAIEFGDNFIGISAHRVTPDIDSGEILLQKKLGIPISMGADNALELLNFNLPTFITELHKIFPYAAQNFLTEYEPSYAARRTYSSARLSKVFTEKSLVNFIRACQAGSNPAFFKSNNGDVLFEIIRSLDANDLIPEKYLQDDRKLLIFKSKNFKFLVREFLKNSFSNWYSENVL